jgi:hypothetical protein
MKTSAGKSILSLFLIFLLNYSSTLAQTNNSVPGAQSFQPIETCFSPGSYQYGISFYDNALCVIGYTDNKISIISLRDNSVVSGYTHIFSITVSTLEVFTVDFPSYGPAPISLDLTFPNSGEMLTAGVILSYKSYNYNVEVLNSW